MKKVIFAVLTVAALTSCANKYDVKLSNGSIVKAVDMHDRNYHRGDKVCVDNPLSYGSDWTIDSRGDMIDTVYTDSYINAKQDTVTYLVERRLGVIIK